MIIVGLGTSLWCSRICWNSRNNSIATSSTVIILEHEQMSPLVQFLVGYAVALLRAPLLVWIPSYESILRSSDACELQDGRPCEQT